MGARCAHFRLRGCIRPARRARPVTIRVSPHEHQDDDSPGARRNDARQPARQRAGLRPERRSSGDRWRDSRQRSSQGPDRRWRAAQLRSGVHEHRVVPERDHVHRRRQGDPALPRLSDRAARGQGRLPRGRVAAAPRRAADAGRVRPVGARHHVPHVRAREHQDVHGRVPLRRAPDVDAVRTVAALSSFYPTSKNIYDREEREHRVRAADREAADARGVRVPAREGDAVRLSRQLAAVRRELPAR